MSRRRPAILALLAGLLVLPAPSALAGTTAGEDDEPPRIAENVSAGGVDVSGLTVRQAAIRLEDQLAPRLGRTITVRALGSDHRLRPRDAELDLRSRDTAQRALLAGRRRPARDADEPVDVLPIVTYSRARVEGFVGGIGRRVYRPARNARVRIAVTRVRLRRARKGRRLDAERLVESVTDAFVRPSRRRVRGQIHRTSPAFTSAEARRRYSTVITIHQRTFTLRLFKRFRLVRRYGVAVGQPQYPTPRGLFAIQSKERNPAWTAPNSPWAGELAGTTTPGGSPNNPLKARWMGVTGSVGIHGTGEEGSIGSRASHGCIRMRVRDVKLLYDRVYVGTPVLIR